MKIFLEGPDGVEVLPWGADDIIDYLSQYGREWDDFIVARRPWRSEEWAFYGKVQNTTKPAIIVVLGTERWSVHVWDGRWSMSENITKMVRFFLEKKSTYE